MQETQTLRAWRATKSKSLKDVAESLGVNVTTVARWELGAMLPDADMVERIERLTGSAVTAADMHAVRLTWLKANRPEKFAALEAAE